MNNDKTYIYFFLAKNPPTTIWLQMKVNDNVFIPIISLFLSLEKLSIVDLYYDFVIPYTSTNMFMDYISWMRFVLSWDLVKWIVNKWNACLDCQSVITLPDVNIQSFYFPFGHKDEVVVTWLKIEACLKLW